MPRKSQKACVIDKIYYDAAISLLQLNSADDSEEDSAIHEELQEDLQQALSYRFGSMVEVPKQKAWFSEVLPTYDEVRFQQVTRLSREEFEKIFNLVKDHPVFHTKNNQLPVEFQVAIALYRFGIYGTGGSLHNVARMFGTGDGSTIVRCTRRVIKAILALKDRYVYWPDKDERDIIVAETFSDLPRCIGFIDCTKVPLEEAPTCDKDSYYDKDKNYSITVQIICDNQKRIRNFVAGYPGSIHDSRVWNECSISKEAETYFSDGQYLSGDKGYGLSKYVITPFRENSKAVPHNGRKKFNTYFSSHRVKIEHVNGVLKETFGSLKELRVRIRDEKSHKEAIDWITACLILYNIILPLRNCTPDQVTSTNPEDDSNDADGNTEDDFSSEDKRMALYYFIMDKIAQE